MAFTSEDIRANRDFFAQKLRVERQKNDVAQWAKGEASAPSFVLLDTRGRDAFAKGHVKGAICVPLQEIDKLVEQLPRDKELVTYCWNST